MAGNAGINGRHYFLPLVAHLVKIGVADAAEENLDLDVVCAGIAPGDHGGGKRRCGAGCGVRFGFMHEVTSVSRTNTCQMQDASKKKLPHRFLHPKITQRGPSGGIPILLFPCLFLPQHRFLCTIAQVPA
jgi:hypothetical protein